MADLKPTTQRKFTDFGHQPPHGKHARGRERSVVWQGTSRLVDPASKRRNNKRSWRKLVTNARREYVARQRGE